MSRDPEKKQFTIVYLIYLIFLKNTKIAHCQKNMQDSVILKRKRADCALVYSDCMRDINVIWEKYEDVKKYFIFTI